MDCALWLNRKKIFSAAEIPANLDIAALRGYFLAGSLVRWLNEHGGRSYARRLEKLSPADPELNEKIAKIFAAADGENTAVISKKFGCESAPPTAAADNIPSSYLPSSLPLSSYFTSSFLSSSYLPSSFPQTLYGSGGSFAFSSGISSLLTYLGGSFEYGFGSFGYLFGSYNYYFGSFGYLFGSFDRYYSSFGGQFGSYGSAWLWEWLMKYFYSFGSLGGSYGSAGYAFGSYEFGSFWEWYKLFGNLGSFNWGNIGSFADFGSFPADLEKLPLDEYDLIMLRTLINCPLDRFGYGIHNI